MITSIYIQMNGRFFTFDDSIRMPHAARRMPPRGAVLRTSQ